MLKGSAVPDQPPDHPRDESASLDRRFVATMVVLTIVWLIGAYWLVEWFSRTWLN